MDLVVMASQRSRRCCVEGSFTRRGTSTSTSARLWLYFGKSVSELRVGEPASKSGKAAEAAAGRAPARLW